MRDWVRMTSLSTSLRCSSGRSRVDSTSRLVRIAVSGVRSSWAEAAAKSRADVSAALVRSCSSQIRSSMPLMASAISTASVAPRTSMSGASSPASIIRVCCGQPPERPHRERGEQPAQHRRGADRERTDDQHAAVQVVGVGDGRRRRWRRRPPTSGPGPGSRRCAPGSARRRCRCRHSRRPACGSSTSEFDFT